MAYKPADMAMLVKPVIVQTGTRKVVQASQVREWIGLRIDGRGDLLVPDAARTLGQALLAAADAADRFIAANDQPKGRLP